MSHVQRFQEFHWDSEQAIHSQGRPGDEERPWKACFVEKRGSRKYQGKAV